MSLGRLLPLTRLKLTRLAGVGAAWGRQGGGRRASPLPANRRIQRIKELISDKNKGQLLLQGGQRPLGRRGAGRFPPEAPTTAPVREAAVGPRNSSEPLRRGPAARSSSSLSPSIASRILAISRGESLMQTSSTADSNS